jgi:hypothetical protein
VLSAGRCRVKIKKYLLPIYVLYASRYNEEKKKKKKKKKKRQLHIVT